MKTTRTVEVQVVQTVVMSIRCNKCGVEMLKEHQGDILDRNDLSARVYGLAEHSIHGGYDSTHLLDLNSYTFSLCEACLVDLMTSFVLPPTVVGMYDGPTTWAEDRAIRKSMDDDGKRGSK